MEGNLFYDCRWSTDCDLKFIDDFDSVQDQVFKGAHSRGLFKRQYLDNIYGPSVLVVVYDGDTPIAARALWRNDIAAHEAYQPGRTCVLSNYRGLGIFGEMTKQAIAMLPRGVVIYNFPNQYSYPGYLKMGWTTIGEFYMRLFSVNKFIREHPVKMDFEYYNWWVKDNSSIKYIKKGNLYFLVRRYSRPLCYKVIAQVDKGIAENCGKASPFALFFYNSQEKTFYNKKTLPLRPVGKGLGSLSLPLWKIDAI